MIDFNEFSSKEVENLKQIVPVNRDTDQLTTPDDPAAEFKEKLIIKDFFSTYCLDCNNENLKPEMIKL